METIKNTLECAYLEYSASKTIILGFPVSDSVYYAFVPLSEFFAFCGQSKTSDDCPVFRLRVKPLTAKTSALFFSYNPQILCSISELEQVAAESYDNNRGYAFEKLITQAINARETPQNTPFWVSGDCIKNSIPYQIKYQYATVITENHLIELTKIYK